MLEFVSGVRRPAACPTSIVVVTHDENIARRSSRRVNMKDGELLGGSETALPPPYRARIAASGITMRDLVFEAIAGAIARPTRMALTVLGIVIGMSALVATIGMTRTAGNRIISQHCATTDACCVKSDDAVPQGVGQPF